MGGFIEHASLGIKFASFAEIICFFSFFFVEKPQQQLNISLAEIHFDTWVFLFMLFFLIPPCSPVVP